MNNPMKEHCFKVHTDERLNELERIQGLMRTVINELDSQIHDIIDQRDETFNPFTTPLTDEDMASPEVQKATADLFDRKIGDYDLPAEHTVASTPNQQEGESISDMINKAIGYPDFEEEFKFDFSTLPSSSFTDDWDEIGPAEDTCSSPVLDALKRIKTQLEAKLEPELCEEVVQVEVWECPEGNHHVALRLENNELEALADFADDEVWNARAYAAAYARREGLALYDCTAEGPVDQ